MDTYPSEFLCHPVPVLAVYGLEVTDTAATAEQNAQPSDTETTKQSSSSTNAVPMRSELAKTLTTIFTNKPTYTVYDAVANSTQHGNSVNAPYLKVIQVPENFTFPERASTPPNAPLMHSPLSPLSPQSPLHPDGLISTSWVKKHLETPSVVVGFYTLWDPSAEVGSPPKPKREVGPLASHVLIDPAEREKDAALVQKINDRRKYFQDKGVKFSAVILLDAKQTEDGAVEERLSMIKKQSGLDSKYSFFTVASGPQQEIEAFVKDLYRSSYDAALHFYANRIKKIRKKRAKLPSTANASRPSMIDLGNTEPQPLPVQGWLFRSYENAYTILAEILAPVSSASLGLVHLPVHSKRWYEARVLVDSLNIKICRFYLALNDSASAVAQLNGHLHMFQTYAMKWSMGDQSFEYWEWLSKQYRIFADVVDDATQHGFKIPLSTAYTSSNTGSSMGIGSPLLGNAAGNLSGGSNLSGCNPAAILQHPGFYYHLAAMCCAERRRRFIELERATLAKASANAGSASETEAGPTGLEQLLAQERQVNHSGLTIELLTKSYEQFKRHRNGRMTLYLAAEIAGTYYETGKFEMALKFFERIGKTYRKENWHMVLTSILRWSLRCAKELQSWDRTIECLIELLSGKLPMTDQKRQDIQQELMDIIHKQEPIEHSPMVINMDQINTFVHCSVQFQSQTNFVDTAVPFQITLTTDKTSPPLPFRFSAMRIIFNDAQYNMILRDTNTEEGHQKMELIDCTDGLTTVAEGDHSGWQTKDVDLGITSHQKKVIQAAIFPKECGQIKMVGIYLDLISAHWNIALHYPLDTKVVENEPPSRRKWLEESKVGDNPKFKLLGGRGELHEVRIMQKPPRIDIKAAHHTPALLNEHYKVCVAITNRESESILGKLSVTMKNIEGAVNGDFVSFDDGSAEMKQGMSELDLGTIASGETVTKEIYLHGDEVSGSRLVTMTVGYTMSSTGKSNPLIEKTELVRIPFVAPFDTKFELCTLSEKPSHATSPVLDKAERWLVIAAIKCCSAWDLEIQDIQLEFLTVDHPNVQTKLLSGVEGFHPQQWKTGHVYNADYLFRLVTDDLTEPQPPIPIGSIAIYWRRHGEKQQYAKTLIPLPTIQSQQPSLVVMADVPAEIYVGEPFTLTYTVDNPTVHLAEYTASMELSEAFVFSGYKQLKSRVLPLSRCSYDFTCYPLIAGKVKLPRLKVIAKQQGAEKEIPVEFIGSGSLAILDHNLQAKGVGAEQQNSLLVFANARREF
ncbi:Gryzun, putative trafficking through golgi-domain-containing protein [Radiomyces spectabilis]|uniref:Gryzun, putative trafficking through golgi-domain-containing protein n=1 Tax=Radiomyces spectabilis TaxID=64574 RepID=UPI00221FC910|nr:Gryzun, putative trafficking through golgi-domain-containing protein [Radiomyces spectabilis]KAI8374513.1 Gryzun, putative trafficking through golgi-domain-containing protein [Radiomyces spectabilis]